MSDSTGTILIVAILAYALVRLGEAHYRHMERMKGNRERRGKIMKLAIITAHAGATTAGECLQSWGGQPPVYFENGAEGMLSAYQAGYECAKADGFEFLAFFHDDLRIDEGWLYKVSQEFEDPQVGLVGLGGSRTHGSDQLYNAPYQIMQLSRGTFLSNMRDAEVHGVRYQGPPIDVAALDGFALIFRRELLEKAGGFPVGKLVFHGYDFWATCMAHRLGYRVRLVPIACHHYGGMTSVGQRMDDGQNHAKGHEWIYNEFRDVLPFRAEDR